MKIPGYSGICACCFGLIKDGDETHIREGSRTFHKSCVQNSPGNYYVKLEKRNLARYGAKVAAGDKKSPDERGMTINDERRTHGLDPINEPYANEKLLPIQGDVVG